MRVKLVVAEDSKKGVPGVKVSLYDRDWKSEDDPLGTDVTDAKGEIFFDFQEKDYQDVEDGPDWRIESLPDLYVNVHDGQDKVIYSTRDVVERDKFPQLLIVPIPRAILEQHGLVNPTQ
jgi:hypothetical protein